MQCPRRAELGGAGAAVFKLPPEDSYGDRDACSYCGSLNPDTFMARLEDGSIELCATDKEYKVYVSGTDPNRPLQTVKFYFMHLSEPQMIRFVELYNEDKFKFQGGIRFYVWPYFMRQA